MDLPPKAAESLQLPPTALEPEAACPPGSPGSSGSPSREGRASDWSFVLHVAARYFRTARADAFGRVLSRMTTGGLVVGVAALVLALAALTGFQEELLSDVRSRTPQLQIELAGADEVEAVRAEVSRWPQVRASQLVEYGRGWLIDRGELLPVEVVGYEADVPRWFPEAARSTDGPAGLLVSGAMMERFTWLPGDTVRLVSPRSTLTPIGPKPRQRSYPVTGTYQASRSPHEFVRVALPLEETNKLFAGSDLRLDVELIELEVMDEMAASLRAALPGVRLSTWRDDNRALLFVLRLEKGLIFVAVALIVVVASFALMSSLALILASKRAEVGVLSTLGASQSRLRRVFLLLGAFLAAGGALSGGVLGVVTAKALDSFEVFRLPSDVYIVDYVPFSVRTGDVAVVLGATLALTLISSWWASRRVVSLDPIEAIRGARG